MITSTDTDHAHNESVITILRQFNIDETPIRIQVLRIILRFSTAIFTIQDVYSVIAEQNLGLKRSTVLYSIALYKTRKLITEIPTQETFERRAGRRKMLFVCSPATLRIFASLEKIP